MGIWKSDLFEKKKREKNRAQGEILRNFSTYHLQYQVEGKNKVDRYLWISKY